MPEISAALTELRRLGLHLDPAAAAAEAEARRVRLNTRTYPLYRALGFQLILLMVLAHDLAFFGDVPWRSFLAYVVVVELYVLAAWLAVRRWFHVGPVIRDWDVSDLFFLADLLLFAGAIAVAGGTRSWMFFLPLVRVADHRGAPRVFAFAAAAPAAYLLVVLAEALGGGSVPWGTEAVKVALLAGTALYIAWTGKHVQTLQGQREAAVKAAAELLRSIRDRTERLDQANRARGDLIARVRDGLGGPLVEIVGFSQSLLRGSGPKGASEMDYIQRIHQQARWVLRVLEDLPELPDLSARWPRVSLNGILQDAVAREAEREDAGRARGPATLELPEGDVEVRTEPKQLTALVGHLLSAARHFSEAAPAAALRLDPATGLPDDLEVTAPLPAGNGTGRSAAELMNPFATGIHGDQQEMGARFELSLARSLAEILGYRLELDAAPGRLRLLLRLR